MWEGEGIPIFLHHGFMSSASLNWEQTSVVAALTETGRPVIALDARGHGNSEKPVDPERYGEPRMAIDVMELLDHLGVHEVDLVGYSMGAVVALVVATEEDRVRRLVLGGLGARVVEGGFDALNTADETVAQALEVDDPDDIRDPFVRSFRGFADSADAYRPALIAHIRAPREGKLEPSLITVPTLVIAGEHDLLARDVARLAEAIPGAELKVIAGDHLTAPSQPEFKQAVVDFLTRPAAQSATENSSPR